MTTCDVGHEEIVYNTGGGCPLCHAQGEIHILEDQINTLENQITDLGNYIISHCRKEDKQ